MENNIATIKNIPDTFKLYKSMKAEKEFFLYYQAKQPAYYLKDFKPAEIDSMSYDEFYAFAHFPAKTEMLVLAEKKYKSNVFCFVRLKAGSSFIESTDSFDRYYREDSKPDLSKKPGITFLGWVNKKSMAW